MLHTLLDLWTCRIRILSLKTCINKSSAFLTTHSSWRPQPQMALLWWRNEHFHLNNSGHVQHIIMSLPLSFYDRKALSDFPLSEDLLRFFVFFFTPPGSTSPPLRWCKLGTPDRQSFFPLNPMWSEELQSDQRGSSAEKAPGFTYSWHFTFAVVMFCSTMPTTPSGPLHSLLCGLTSFITAQVHWAEMQVVVTQ